MSGSHVVYPTSDLLATKQLEIVRGEGIYVYDASGHRYIDGLSGLWCVALGYANHELIEAATRQLETLSFAHMFGDKTHPVAIRLADRLSDLLPMRDAHVFFGSSGSDANDTQIKLLHYYFDAIGRPEKRKIIARQRAYHGVSVATAGLTSLPAFHAGFDLPIDALGILHTDHAHYYRGRVGDESEQAFVERIVGNLEALILREGPETIAAFVAEPITGASGVIVPPGGYYEAVQSVLDRYEILFWADEVITAFGRTGSPFGCQTMNIETPDLMVLAKQLSSGYMPISAAAISGELYDVVRERSGAQGLFAHGYTYSGHPVAAAVALQALEIYERDAVFEYAAQRGEVLQAELARLADHALVGEVRGRGLLAAVELVADKASGRAFSDGVVGAMMIDVCRQNGLILRAVAGNSIAFCPPLVITDEQISDMVDRFGRSLDQTLADVRQQGLGA